MSSELFAKHLQQLHSTFQNQCSDSRELEQQINANMARLLGTMNTKKQPDEPLKSPQYYARKILQNLRESQDAMVELMILLGPENTVQSAPANDTTPIDDQEGLATQATTNPITDQPTTQSNKPEYTPAELRSGDGTVHPEVLKVLGTLKIDTVKNHVKIEGGQLPRPIYEAVNKILSDLGGEWKSGRIKAHVFDRNPTEEIENIVLTGKFVSDKMMGFFPTPTELCKQLCSAADVQKGHRVLEPSAGTGAIAKVARSLGAEVTCIELEHRRAIVLKEYGFDVTELDFLQYSTVELFDRIVMNPPFGDSQDVDHVNHAYSLLRPGGKLAAIMSGGVRFNQFSKAVQFRELVDSCGSMTELPDESFKESGTQVRTVMVVLTKPNTEELKQPTLNLAVGQ